MILPLNNIFPINLSEKKEVKRHSTGYWFSSVRQGRKKINLGYKSHCHIFFSIRNIDLFFKKKYIYQN